MQAIIAYILFCFLAHELPKFLRNAFTNATPLVLPFFGGVETLSTLRFQVNHQLVVTLIALTLIYQYCKKGKLSAGLLPFFIIFTFLASIMVAKRIENVDPMFKYLNWALIIVLFITAFFICTEWGTYLFILVLCSPVYIVNTLGYIYYIIYGEKDLSYIIYNAWVLCCFVFTYASYKLPEMYDVLWGIISGRETFTIQ